MNVTAKEVIAYLYFRECGQDCERVAHYIFKKIRPSATNEEIKKEVSKHPEWLNDYICVMDIDYPNFLKRVVPFDYDALYFHKDRLEDFEMQYK